MNTDQNASFHNGDLYTEIQFLAVLNYPIFVWCLTLNILISTILKNYKRVSSLLRELWQCFAVAYQNQ